MVSFMEGALTMHLHIPMTDGAHQPTDKIHTQMSPGLLAQSNMLLWLGNMLLWAHNL